MAKKRKSEQSQEVLLAIKSWKSTHSIFQNGPLDKLVEDIKLNQNLKIWADIDPESYLPNPEPKDLLSKIKLANTITGIRNILVFSPVALTWSAISVVTSAFSTYEKANPNSITNFLEFWQQGFGYLSDFWKLSNVAFFDAILVLIVILLTFAVNLITRKNNELEALFESDIQESKSQLSFQIQEFLYQYKYPSQVQVSKNLYSATKSLDKSLKSLNKLVAQLERDISKYPSSTKIVSELKALTKEVKKTHRK